MKLKPYTGKIGFSAGSVWVCFGREPAHCRIKPTVTNWCLVQWRGSSAHSSGQDPELNTQHNSSADPLQSCLRLRVCGLWFYNNLFWKFTFVGWT